MSNLEYPTRESLSFWIQFLQKENSTLKLSLPNIDEHWYEHMLAVVERVQHSYSPDELHTRAAELFYNTNKAHAFADGNKRSSILIVYLFYILNGYYITSRLNIRKIAKQLAKSRGRVQHDSWIRKLKKCFAENTASLEDGLPEHHINIPLLFNWQYMAQLGQRLNLIKIMREILC